MSVSTSAKSTAFSMLQGARTRPRKPPLMGQASVSAPVIWTGRGLVLLALIGGWQLFPTVESLQGLSPIFDEFFVSSPLRVQEQLGKLLLGGELEFWRHLWFTTQGLFLGFFFGMTAAVSSALILTNSPLLRKAFTPIIDVINAVPTVAMVPLFVVMFGPTLLTSTVVATQTVFFFAFFNAYGGAASMPSALKDNASLLGATPRDVMWRIRARYALAWTIEIVPAAIGRALTAAFVAELFSGSPGFGRLVRRALLTINSDLTFSVVIVLSVFGVVLSGLVKVATRRYLHWWPSSR